MLLGFATLAVLCLNVLGGEGNWTLKHEEGRCAMRGQCGKKSFFGGELPCPDNGLAEEPDEDTRTKLVAICGDDWSEGDVCCDEPQVSSDAGRTRYPYERLTRSDRQSEKQPQTRRRYYSRLPGM